MPEDQLAVTNRTGIGPWNHVTAYPRSPVRFDEFADAMKAIDCQEINNVVTGGRSSEVLHSGLYLLSDPQAPPAEDIHFYTDQPGGEHEGAREVLPEVGWGCDDKGNLRYPEGKDRSPLWPEGETPSPEDFPCLDEMNS